MFGVVFFERGQCLHLLKLVGRREANRIYAVTQVGRGVEALACEYVAKVRAATCASNFGAAIAQVVIV
jgi:hypothetical protein